MLSLIIYFQKRHVQIHHVLMAVHVLYLTVAITVHVCYDLQVHDVKVGLYCHSIFNDAIINPDYQFFYYDFHVHGYEYFPSDFIFLNCLPSSLFTNKVCMY
jgi:hypothetical protein